MVSRFKKRLLRKKEQRKIAKERIAILFELAKKNQDYAKRYIELAGRIAKKYRIQQNFKELFCPSCLRYLIAGQNCKIRIIKKKVIIRCICGNIITKKFLNIRYKQH